MTHTVSGWHFRRGADGSVTVYAEACDEVVLTADEWAAAVAAMSYPGRIPATITAATSLHLAGVHWLDPHADDTREVA